MAAVRAGVGRETAHEADQGARGGASRSRCARRGRPTTTWSTRLAADERLNLPPGALDAARGPVVVHRRRDGAGRGGRRPGRRDHRRVSGGRRLHAGSHPVKLLHSGKVRDVYADGDDLLLVASDRMSIYDVVLPTPIPDKGAVLTAAVAVVVRPARRPRAQPRDLRHGRARRSSPGGPCAAGGSRCCRSSASPAATSPGPASRTTTKTGVVSGVALPPGLVDGSRLPEPVFTPSTKAPLGQHDETMTFGEVEDLVGADTAAAAARADPGRLRPGRRDGGGERASSSPTPSSSSAATRRRARSCSPTRC